MDQRSSYILDQITSSRRTSSIQMFQEFKDAAKAIAELPCLLVTTNWWDGRPKEVPVLTPGSAVMVVAGVFRTMLLNLESLVTSNLASKRRELEIVQVIMQYFTDHPVAERAYAFNFAEDTPVRRIIEAHDKLGQDPECDEDEYDVLERSALEHLSDDERQVVLSMDYQLAWDGSSGISRKTFTLEFLYLQEWIFGLVKANGEIQRALEASEGEFVFPSTSRDHRPKQ